MTSEDEQLTTQGLAATEWVRYRIHLTATPTRPGPVLGPGSLTAWILILPYYIFATAVVVLLGGIGMIGATAITIVTFGYAASLFRAAQSRLTYLFGVGIHRGAHAIYDGGALFDFATARLLRARRAQLTILLVVTSAALAFLRLWGPALIPAVLTFLPTAPAIRYGEQRSLTRNDPDDLDQLVENRIGPQQYLSWIQLGVRETDAMARWFGAGLTPGTAKPWIRRGVDPKTAGSWHESGFSAKSSFPWRRLGHDAAGAATWRGVGLGSLRARRWERAGFDASTGSCWYENGFRRRTVAVWKAVGFTSPSEAGHWRKAGYSPKTARAWESKGITASLAREWASSQLSEEWHVAHSPRIAEAWQAAEFTPDEYRRWVHIVPDPARAASWRDHVSTNPTDIAAWQAARILSPAIASRLLGSGIDAATASLWHRLGVVDSVDITDWQSNWAPDTAARWISALAVSLPDAWAWSEATGNDLSLALHWSSAGIREPRVVADWLRNSFTLTEAVAWSRAGIATARASQEWTNAGHTASETASWRAAGISKASDVDRLRSAGIHQRDAALWRDHGVANIDTLLEWNNRWPATEAAEWLRVTGSRLQGSWDWRSFAKSMETYRRWCQLGFSSVEDAKAATSEGLEPDSVLSDLERLRSAGVGTPEPAVAWLRRLSATQALAWIAVGCRSPDGAEAWMEHGFDAQSAQWWLNVTDMPATARDWARATGDKPADAHEWRDAGFRSPDVVARLTAEGVRPPEATHWHALRVRDSDALLDWRRHWPVASALQWTETLRLDLASAFGFWELTGRDLAAAVDWVRAGFPTSSTCDRWHSANFSPTDAAEWSATGLTPEAARDWKTTGHCAAESKIWRTAEVTLPTRAQELKYIGFTANSYADATAQRDAKSVRNAIRRQAIKYAGLEICSDNIPVLHVEAGNDLPLEAINRFARAAAEAGESALRIHHGSPHLSRDAIRAVPGARYVRGGAKARLWSALDRAEVRAAVPISDPSSGAPHRVADEGNSTDIALVSYKKTREFLMLEAGAVT